MVVGYVNNFRVYVIKRLELLERRYRFGNRIRQDRALLIGGKYDFYNHKNEKEIALYSPDEKNLWYIYPRKTTKMAAILPRTLKDSWMILPQKLLSETLEKYAVEGYSTDKNFIRNVIATFSKLNDTIGYFVNNG